MHMVINKTVFLVGALVIMACLVDLGTGSPVPALSVEDKLRLIEKHLAAQKRSQEASVSSRTSID